MQAGLGSREAGLGQHFGALGSLHAQEPGGGTGYVQFHIVEHDVEPIPLFKPVCCDAFEHDIEAVFCCAKHVDEPLNTAPIVAHGRSIGLPGRQVSNVVGEHAVAAMYVPIALALYTLTNKSTPSPKLGTLLMVTIAVGCMIGGPMSPTGGARNALMIGFLADYGIPVSFMEWISMGVMYTIVMSVVMAFLLPMLFKPEVDDLSEAVGLLKKDLEKHGAMTNKQKLVAGIMALVVVMWITDKSLVKDILGFSLGLGGIAITGAVLYMLFGLTSWKDYEDKVSWGVIVLYAKDVVQLWVK
mgnify:CR=1 FL=1